VGIEIWWIVIPICVMGMVIIVINISNNKINRDIKKLNYKYHYDDNMIAELKEYNRVLGKFDSKSAASLTDKEKVGYDLVSYSADPVFNSILSYKKQRAEEQGIEMLINASSSENLDWNMSEADTTALLSNILDNAMEAAIGCENAHIIIDIKPGRMEKIVVTNSKSKGSKLRYDGNTIKTSKGNDREHGFGIAVINEIVDKYGGRVEFVDLDDEFRACLELPKKAIKD
jgi:sensor histidine kinase regulating citrate/malate metabolism